MKRHVLAAAIPLANRWKVPATPAEDGSVWDNTVCRPIVENGVIVDVRNPSCSERTVNAAAGAGRFGGDCIQVTNGAAFTLSNTPFSLTSDFTIEGWFKFDSLTRNNQYMVDLGSNGFTIRYYNTSNGTGIGVYLNGSTQLINTTVVPTVNRWYHIAVVRQSGILKLYIDGVMQGQVVHTTSMSYSTVTLGNFGGGGAYSILGFVDQFRIVTEAIYTANFTPPSATFPVGGTEVSFDPYWANVSCLAAADNGTTIIDKTGLNTITANGGATIDATIKKIASASMNVVGSGRSFSLPAGSTRFDFGSDDWCVEAWIRPTQVNSGLSTIAGRLRTQQGVGGGWVLELSNMVPQIRVSASTNSWGLTLVGPAAAKVQTNVWTHVAAVRNGNTILLFTNGELVASGSFTVAVSNSSFAVTVGNDTDRVAPFNGYIDSLRITRGKPRYTSNFTPRQKTAFASNGVIVPSNADHYYGTVQALLGYDKDISAGPDMYSMVLTRNDSTIDSTKKLFGKNTLKIMTGATGGINYSNGTKTTLGSGNSCAEGWINTSYSGVTTLPIVAQYHASSSGAWVLGVSSGKGLFYVRGTISLQGSKNIADGTWHHVAVSIRAGVAYLYIDGILEASGNLGGVFPTYNGNIQVGYNIVGEVPAGSQANIARVRITSGEGRYTSNFTADEKTIPLVGAAA